MRKNNAGKKTRYYTLLLLREEGQISRLRFSQKTLRVIAVLLVVVAVAGLALLADYVRGKLLIQRLELAGAAVAESGEPAASDDAAEQPAAKKAKLVNASELLREMEIRRQALAPMERFFNSESMRFISLPDRWPLRGWVTSDFGRRRSPFTFGWIMHQGVDIAAAVGSQVMAPATAEVLFTGEEPGYGRYLILLHGHGLTTHYGHLDRILVTLGQEVRAGDIIARSGNSGQSTGPHLHYEIRLHNIPVDPQRYLPAVSLPQSEGT